jgi:DNA-binding transcriptional LysR family regulator
MNNIKMLPNMLMFAEVAKLQSFTLAAKQLGVSKSGVSQQIKRLEQHLGQQLLSRHTRGMSVTAVGEKLLARCELLQGQVNLAFEELSSTKETPSGVFAITIPHSCESDIVIPALRQLCIEFPLLEPNVMVSDEAKDLIQENLDVAIYGGDLKDSNYRALPIGAANEIFCATPAYVMKYGEVKQPAQFHLQKCISTPWQTSPIAIYKNDARTQKLDLEVSYSAHSNTLTSTIEMVLHDMGVALVPEFAVQSKLKNGQLIRVLPEYQGRQWPFYLVHRFHGDKPIHISRFYQLVTHFFAKTTTLPRNI